MPQHLETGDPTEPKWPLTLDLADRANLAINHLTRNVDQKRGCLPYFWTFLLADPPEARHECYDWVDITGRFLDALLLDRHMTGSKAGLDVERKLKALLLSRVDEEDGLCYMADSAWSIHEAEVFDQSSAMLALVTWYVLERKDSVKKRIDNMIQGLQRIAVKRGNYAYFGRSVYPPGYRGPPEHSSIDEIYNPDRTYFGGRTIMSLVKYYEVTGSEEALSLAAKLTNFLVHYIHITPLFYRNDMIGLDGSFQRHFHSRVATAVGILRYGICTNKKEFIEFAKRVYDWAAAAGSKFGWFPEFLGRGPITDEDCETCIITDMIHLAVKLAEAGHERYWNDAERYIRNQLVENQLTRIDWLHITKNKDDTERSSFDNVAARVLGGFTGWSAPNDFIGNNPRTSECMSACCSGAGGRALFLAWSSIVTKKGDGVYVNLLLSRDSKWVRVASYHPYEGKLMVIVHEAPEVLLRVPDWVDMDMVRLTVDDTERAIQWFGTYVRVSSLKTGQKIIVTYPMNKWQETTTIGGRSFVITWRGDTVVAIDPPGRKCPLYRRRELDRDQAPMSDRPVRYLPKLDVRW